MSNEEWIEEGLKRGFMIPLKGKYTLTNELHRNYVPLSAETGLVVAKKEVTTSSTVMDTNTLFMEFIKACEVPTRCPTAKYWLNRYNKDGAKEFARILTKENVNINVLVASTKLYYKTTKEYAKTISNYITEGIWRTGYQDMMTNAQQGTVQNYIKEEIRGDSNTLDL